MPPPLCQTVWEFWSMNTVSDPGMATPFASSVNCESRSRFGVEVGGRVLALASTVQGETQVNQTYMWRVRTNLGCNATPSKPESSQPWHWLVIFRTSVLMVAPGALAK